MRDILDAIIGLPHAEEHPPGPRFARPEDRLRARLEARAGLFAARFPLMSNFFSKARAWGKGLKSLGSGLRRNGEIGP
jgi:hypothetical protein